MKFVHSESQPDPSKSFLDVIFCLCVMLCFALAVNSFVPKKSQTNETKNQLKKEKKINSKVQVNRFSGRGGQPRLKIVFDYDKDDVGFVVRVGGLKLIYQDFRKIICNIDRKESDGQPSFMFSVKLSDRYKNVKFEEIYFNLNKKICVDTIKKFKEKDSNWWIVNLYKMRYNDLEKCCRKFKFKNTSEYLGNWDSDSIKSKNYTAYEERKKKGKPFIWFTVNNKSKRVVLGPKEDCVVLKPVDFVTFISSIEGNDGFYLEYRDPNTLEYKVNTVIPDWVLKEIIEPLGYDACTEKRGV